MTDRTRRWWRGLAVIAGLAAGIGLIALLVSLRQPPSRGDGQTAAAAVAVIEVAPLDFRIEARGHGIARPAQTWQAIANVPGRVAYRHPKLESGTLVPAGTRLLKLDASRYQLARTEARAELARLAAEQRQITTEAANTRRLLALERERLSLAEQELARIERLAERGSVSQSRRDAERRTALAQREAVQSLGNELALVPSRRERLTAQRERATAQLAQVAQDIVDTRFVAPYDLRVGTVEAELHQYVSAGQRLFEADGIAAAEVTAQVPLPMLRRLMGAVQPPQPHVDALDLSERLDFSAIDAEVILAAGEAVRWPGRVVRVARGLNPQTRAAQVVVRVEAPYRDISPAERPALQPNMYVRVRLTAAAPEPQLVVPATAVHQGEIYFVDERRRLVRRPVTVAFEQHDLAVIAAGLVPGATVVVDDLAPALDGMLLDPRRDTALEQRLRRGARGETP